MIAISILLTWLALGAAAFLTLSALGRVAARHDFEAQLAGIGAGETPRHGTFAGAGVTSLTTHSAAHPLRTHVGRADAAIRQHGRGLADGRLEFSGSGSAT